eukprot:1109366-Prorocentrum_minimum.AAC.1
MAKTSPVKGSASMRFMGMRAAEVPGGSGSLCSTSTHITHTSHTHTHTHSPRSLTRSLTHSLTLGHTRGSLSSAEPLRRRARADVACRSSVRKVRAPTARGGRRGGHSHPWGRATRRRRQ